MLVLVIAIFGIILLTVAGLWLPVLVMITHYGPRFRCRCKHKIVGSYCPRCGQRTKRWGVEE